MLGPLVLEVLQKVRGNLFRSICTVKIREENIDSRCKFHFVPRLYGEGGHVLHDVYAMRTIQSKF